MPSSTFALYFRPVYFAFFPLKSCSVFQTESCCLLSRRTEHKVSHLFSCHRSFAFRKHIHRYMGFWHIWHTYDTIMYVCGFWPRVLNWKSRPAYKHERLGTDRARTVLSDKHVRRNSRYRPCHSLPESYNDRSCEFFVIKNCAFLKIFNHL